MKRHHRANGVIAVLLVVIALAAMAEVVAGRGVVSPPDVPRAASWQPLLRTGDLARAHGDAPAARRAYLAGLFRARGERSVEGVLRVAEGFAALGDQDVVDHALRMAAAIDAERAAEGALRLHSMR